jgi:hypothetical protein
VAVDIFLAGRTGLLWMATFIDEKEEVCGE